MRNHPVVFMSQEIWRVTGTKLKMRFAYSTMPLRVIENELCCSE